MVDVMGLLAEASIPTGQTCRTCVWLEGRPADERDKWRAALEDRGSWEGTRIVRAMAMVPGQEWSPTIASVRNHRSGHARNR